MSDTYKATWNPGPPSREFMDGPRFDRGDLDPVHRTVVPCSWAERKAAAKALEVRRALRRQRIYPNSRSVEGDNGNGHVIGFPTIALAAESRGALMSSMQMAVKLQRWCEGYRWRYVGARWRIPSEKFVAVRNATTNLSYRSGSAAAKAMFPEADANELRMATMTILRAARETRLSCKSAFGAMWETTGCAKRVRTGPADACGVAA